MAGSGWHITGQRRTEQMDANGNFGPVVLVSMKTDGGTTATFDIPDKLYNAQYVQATIQEWVDRHDAVAALGSSGA